MKYLKILVITFLLTTFGCATAPVKKEVKQKPKESIVVLEQKYKDVYRETLEYGLSYGFSKEEAINYAIFCSNYAKTIDKMIVDLKEVLETGDTTRIQFKLEEQRRMWNVIFKDVEKYSNGNAKLKGLKYAYLQEDLAKWIRIYELYGKLETWQ